jgi:CheY-like chemotaxis protein
LGGTLTIESKPGLGTNVTLWLPQADAAIPDADEDEETGRAPARGTVLLVDDEELVRASTGDMLADLGYAVAEAGSAEEAIRQIEEGLKPQIILTDQLMPGMTGMELAAALAGGKSKAPVVIVSGYSEDDCQSGGLLRLTKPFKQKELAEILVRALGAKADQ